MRQHIANTQTLEITIPSNAQILLIPPIPEKDRMSKTNQKP